MRELETRRKLERFLPYAYERTGVELELLGCELDGRVGPDPDPERRQIVLAGQPWRRARLHYRLVVPERTLLAVLPPGAHAEAEVVFALRCTPTRLRRTHRVLSAPLQDRLQNGSFDLGADECMGVVDIVPYLIRASAVTAAPGYAHQRGARLASARAWQVRVLPAPPAAGRFLDVRYRSFKGDPGFIAARSNVYRLDCDQDAPVLWINADHDKIAAVLDDRGSTGRKARLREVFYDLIAHSVWMQLFMRAAADVRELDEATYAWQDGVLRQLLPGIFPAVRSHGERLSSLRTLIADDVGLLLDRVDTVLQGRADLSTHMSVLADELLEQGGP
jgi:hypothetical protein